MFISALACGLKLQLSARLCLEGQWDIVCLLFLLLFFPNHTDLYVRQALTKPTRLVLNSCPSSGRLLQTCNVASGPRGSRTACLHHSASPFLSHNHLLCH
ncbi:rCG42155 [Rattus norvegicus]|uniref:RCG42155 n=1 Tax=Rattus norvegicus TaxID=10116 RepID=A6K088_RAT|nr:rCG42155 [Rattus norvegicus]